MALFTFLLAKGAVGVMIKERGSAQRVASLETKSLELEKREVELVSEIKRLETPEGVEKEIREKYNVAQEGEYMAIIVDERKKATTTDKTAGERIKGWWKDLTGRKK